MCTQLILPMKNNMKNTIVIITLIISTATMFGLYIREKTLYGQLESEMQKSCISRLEFDAAVRRAEAANTLLREVSLSLDSTKRIIERRDLIQNNKRLKNENEIARLNSLTADQLDSLLSRLKPNIE